MASISTSFLELKFPSISDANPQCGICWEQGAPERPLFDIHPSTLPKEAEHHIACRICILRWLRDEDLKVEKFFLCHMCREKVSVDLATAISIRMSGQETDRKIFYFTASPLPTTHTLRALEDSLRRTEENEPYQGARRLPKLLAVTKRLICDPFPFK